MIGVGIFKTPSLVAANAGGPGLLILIWILTGKGALVGSAVLFSGLVFILLDYLRLSREGRS